MDGLFIILTAFAINCLLQWSWSCQGIIDTPNTEYDFIIVGGGSAGCVLARRLWENTNYTILVIETGTTAPWISAVPLLAPALQGYTADWAYKTTNQKHSQFGLNDRKSAWPRGKVLGGSSVLNYMIHTWGTKSDFDDLWSRVGPDWNFDSVLPYFKKAESFHRTSGASVSEKRGSDGPMPVLEFDVSESELAKAFLENAKSMGINVGELNGELEHGAMPTQSKIIFEKKKAAKVAAVNLFSGKTHVIRARREIILSGGVIETPKLLLLSGIGPEKHLQDFNINVEANLPGVGSNLRDELNVPLYFHIQEPISITTRKIRSPIDIWKYFSQGKESFSSSSSPSSFGEFRTSAIKSSSLSNWKPASSMSQFNQSFLFFKGHLANSGVEVITRLPFPGNETVHSKIFLMLFNLGSIDEDTFTSISNFKSRAFSQTFPDTKNDSKEGFIILASCTHPSSQGTVRLSSDHPLTPVLIDPNYLSEAKDVKCLAEAMSIAGKLGTVGTLRKYGSCLHLPAYDQCFQFETNMENDKYLECWIRTSAITSYHPVGTCAMGPDDDPLAVLDSKLRVRRVKNLRVVDASSFPYSISGNPHAAVLMLAEKAADIILADHME
ncbi:glucose dehydrogenase [FAD, quinone]-like [Uloborus diversus]|uniref:glucose dehydrogenase [FAD, quinone]-like n=1 Tax=Uloborus diversus TaxID=327109 RepID=UPI0024093FB8|nr:glucose dehydrogenase [FAD, quinone]-like [Uloborus diversus]